MQVTQDNATRDWGGCGDGCGEAFASLSVSEAMAASLERDDEIDAEWNAHWYLAYGSYGLAIGAFALLAVSLYAAGRHFAARAAEEAAAAARGRPRMFAYGSERTAYGAVPGSAFHTPMLGSMHGPFQRYDFLRRLQFAV